MTIKEKAIVMAYTGYTMLAGDHLIYYYKYLDKLFGRPVYTHEFLELKNEIHERARKDFIKLCEKQCKE